MFARTLYLARLLGTLSCALAVAAAQPTFAQSTYSFVTIDGPGDHAGGTTLNAINNTGDVVGFSSNADGSRLTNFVLIGHSGRLLELSIGSAATAMANGINSSRLVVGSAGDNAFLLNAGAFSLQDSSGGLLALPPAWPGRTKSQIAFGINDNDVIVGQFVDAVSGLTPGFIEKNGRFFLFRPNGSATVTNPQSINNQGLVAGFYSADGTHQHGFLYDTGRNQIIFPRDPSTERTAADGLVLTQFLGINDQNQVVGYYQTNNGSQYGFVYDLRWGGYHFLDEPDAAPYKGVQITQITGINNAGKITGFYVDSTGVQHGFLGFPVN
jgi:hypothetical protein